MRRRHLPLVLLAIVVVLAVSAILARVWSTAAAESAAITGLVQAEARGDQSAMLARIQGCEVTLPCRTRVAQDIAALTRPGRLAVLQLRASTGFSLTGTVGTARVAWKVPSSLPIVQCVRVRRTGSALRGLRVQLLAVSLRIKSDADCPAHF
ncbi:MAG: hypothetical protein DLM64_07800 [Solirubrobacterales bacterium]|nr:MAG: hypothetical protein DLM64_07800 [Solirubrobacterales bacterium]